MDRKFTPAQLFKRFPRPWQARSLQLADAGGREIAHFGGHHHGSAHERAALVALIASTINGWQAPESKPPVITWDGCMRSPICIDIDASHEKHAVLWDAFVGAIAIDIASDFLPGMPDVRGKAMVLGARRRAEGDDVVTYFEVIPLAINAVLGA